jgi:2-polyprenyl-3-methyl-5-hydroxy-6-metoxy-1,4-benzoquinol methylase
MGSPEGLHLGSGTRVRVLDDGRHRIDIEAPAGFAGASLAWTTRYPRELIHQIHAVKGLYLCDEIMREEDPGYVERAIRHEVLGYVDAAEFAGKRVLDFGCGAGASTLVLGRLLPPCEIVGIELQERLLRLARLRAALLGRTCSRFLLSPSGTSLPDGIGAFDYIVLSAVFEHLLPGERSELLPGLWQRLNPGGVLFINQTPHRWAPVEMHTTGLPLINYLPDRLALRAAQLSRRIKRGEDWASLLRAGIRGGTIGEILGLLGGRAALLEPKRRVGDRIDLWYGKLSRRHAWLKKGAWAALKLLKPFGGACLVPELTLAIRKLG